MPRSSGDRVDHASTFEINAGRPCPELPGPAALESVRRARIITAPGTWPVAFPHFSATASMEGAYEAHSAGPRGCTTGGAVLRNPAIFVAFQGAPSLAARLQVST